MRKSNTLEVPAKRPARRKVAQAMDDVLATKVLTLAQVLGRSATLLYRDLLGLPLTSFRLVSLLGGRPPMMLNELATHSGIDKSQLSRAISDLVEQGIVSRTTSKTDSRAVQIELAAPGIDLYLTMVKHARKRNERLLEGLSDTKRQQLLTMLDQITVQARNLLGEQETTARSEH